jgi:hypothetical protein
VVTRREGVWPKEEGRNMRIRGAVGDRTREREREMTVG